MNRFVVDTTAKAMIGGAPVTASNVGRTTASADWQMGACL